MDDFGDILNISMCFGRVLTGNIGFLKGIIFDKGDYVSQKGLCFTKGITFRKDDYVSQRSYHLTYCRVFLVLVKQQGDACGGI